LVDVPDQKAGPGRKQAIPRIVYQTAETRLVHPTHAKSIHEFRALNPDLSFQVFDRNKRDRYMAERWSHHEIHDIYRRAIFGQMKADIFRYCIIYDKGGYYLDYNKGAQTRLTELHPQQAEGVVSYEQNLALVFPETSVASRLQQPFNVVMQWFFAFYPRHNFLERVLNRIVEIEPFFRSIVFRQPKNALLAMTGPGVFTSSFHSHIFERGLHGIHQAGIDLEGSGIFRLRGSKRLQDPGGYYGDLRNERIIGI